MGRCLLLLTAAADRRTEDLQSMFECSCERK